MRQQTQRAPSTATEGDTALAVLRVSDVTEHIERALAFIHSCAGTQHYRLSTQIDEGARVATWHIAPLSGVTVAEGTRSPGAHELTASYTAQQRVVACNGTLRSPLPCPDSGLPFPPTPVGLRSVGLLYDFLFLHLCVGIRCLRTMRDFLDTVGSPWLELVPARDDESGRICLELRNKRVPALSLRAHVQPDLALILMLPAANAAVDTALSKRASSRRVKTARSGASFFASAPTIIVPLVGGKAFSTPTPSASMARTGAHASGEEEYETRAKFTEYIEHVGFSSQYDDADGHVGGDDESKRPKPHPVTHAMIGVLTEHALCAPVPGAADAY